MSDVLVRPVSMQVASDVAIPSRRAELTEGERAEMLALLQAHFDGVCESQFARELAGKDWVLRIVRDGTLVGFSTLKVFRASHEGRCINVIYSGDTDPNTRDSILAEGANCFLAKPAPLRELVATVQGAVG